MGRSRFFFMLLGIAVFLGCGKSGGDGGGGSQNSSDDFKKGMLVNYADNIIIPAYVDLNAKLGTLETSVNAFLAAPSTVTLEAVRAPFKSAYQSYEKTSAAYFGPAAALQMNNTVNTWPCVVSKIEAGIQSGVYNLTLPLVSDSIQGFPALDYLFFSAGALGKYPNANREKYVRDVLARMKTLVSGTLGQWQNSYRAAFVASLKTDVGSSIGFMVNQFAFEMDAMKGPRIGWPFGKQSNGIVFADKCEGYYSGNSLSLAVANLTSLKNYFAGGSGDGIADYLVFLKREQLSKDVLAQFDVALGALQAIPEPLSDAFTKNASQVEEAYRQVQKLLTMIKTDVSSATGVQITYMDNDGD
ncbi:MAG: imelysin family protein [Bacteroidetes bacterium]|nr:imelysin family protein [Bacteroidota bacterium]